MIHGPDVTTLYSGASNKQTKGIINKPDHINK